MPEDLPTPKKSLKELEKNNGNIFNIKEENLISEDLSFMID